MYDYEKTLLYIYPMADELAKIYKMRADSKVCSSFYCRDGAEEEIIETITLMNLEGAFKIAKIDVESALLKLSDMERAMIEIQYIRRKSKISALPFRTFPFSERSFYRKVFRAIKKFSSLLKQNGNSEEWFMDTFSACPEVMKVYGKVQRGRDLYYRRRLEGFTFACGREVKRAKLKVEG